jgi:hypothetical protein
LERFTELGCPFSVPSAPSVDQWFDYHDPFKEAGAALAKIVDGQEHKGYIAFNLHIWVNTPSK